MRLKDLRERIKGGKLDPLSKMGRSKLTGQEIATYYRQNPKAKQAARDPIVKKAIELALDLGGNQTLAMKEIEKMKRGLSKNPAVASALRTANEDMTSTSSVAMPEIPLGRKHKVMKRKDLEEAVLGHDFGTNPFSKKEAEEAKKLAKQYSVKVKPHKNPKSKNHLEFHGGTRNLQAFYRNLQMIMNESLEESLKPHEEKISKVFKTKNPVEIKGIDRLIDMSSIGVVQSMQKQNPRGFTKTVMSLGKLKESINEETILYRVKDIQKPELDKFKSSARLMKLKINIKQSPRGKETIIRLEGGKKQIRDFDAVARGKSSYGDPSIVEDAVERAKELADLKAKHKREIEQEKDEIERTKQSAETESVLAQLDALEKQIDLIEQSLLMERQFRLNPNKKPSLFTQWYSRKNQRDKRTQNMARGMYSPEDVIEYHFNSGNLKPGKNIVKDTGASVLARSLGKVMNDERKKARDKGAEFGKGEPKYEMDAPKIKKIIDTIAKGLIINVTRKGKDGVSFTFDKKQGDMFYNLDTYTRDIVWDIMQMGSDGTFYQAVYGEPEGRKLDLKFPDDDNRLVAQTESTELDESVKLSRPAKGQRTITIDFSKAPNPKKAKDKTMSIAKKHGIKTGKPKKPKSKDDVEFTGSKKAMTLFGREFNLAGRTGLLEKQLNEESATMKKVRQVVKKKSMMNVDGTKLDLTTASMIASVYDQVNPQNKKRMDKLKLPQLINLTMKVAGKSRKESTDSPFSLSILERMSGIQNKSTDFIKVPKLNSKQQSYMKKIKKRFPKLPEPVNYEIMRLTHKGNQVDSQKYVEIGNLYDKDYKGGTGGKFIQKLRNMGARLPQGHMGEETILEGRDTYKSIIQGLEKDKKEVAGKSKAFGQNDTKYIDKAINFLKQLEKEGIPAGQISQVDFVTNRVPKFFIGPANRSPSLSKFTPNDVKKAVAHAKKMGIIKEAVSPAQQAAIAISKKERGEKPKNECADEKDFKPHKMYKGDKEVMANTYADHVKYDKMGYTHEKPKKEALDAKDKPFIKDLISKLRGGSKTHAKQADDLEKAMKTENRAKRDAMRDMGKRKDKEDDGYGVATDDDRKAADKNVIMQIRRVADLPKGGQIELPNGKKVKMDRKSAIELNKKFNSIRKPQDKLKLQKMMNDKKISVVALKRLLGK